MLRLNRVIDKGDRGRGRGLHRRAGGHAVRPERRPGLRRPSTTPATSSASSTPSSRSCSAIVKQQAALAGRRPMRLVELLPALPWLAPFASLVRLADARPNLTDVAPASGDAGLGHHSRPERSRDDRDRGRARSWRPTTGRSSCWWWMTARPTTPPPVVERLAARRPRLRLRVRRASCPTGWYGKPWACAPGIPGGARRAAALHRRRHPPRARAAGPRGRAPCARAGRRW